MIVVIPLLPILIILLLFVFGIIGNANAIIDNIFFFVALISIILNIIICFIEIISQEANGCISKIRKILSCIFCIIMPIVIVGLFLESNNFYSEMSNSWNGYTFVYKYQKAIVFPISALIGCLVNILMLLINYGARKLETKTKSLSLFFNLLAVIIMVMFPVCGEKIANNINLTRCNNGSYKETYTVKQDSFVFSAIRTNYEKKVDVNDTSIIELKIINRNVEKGELLFGTGRKFERGDVKYLEVYNKHTYGYIDKNSVKVHQKAKK